MLTGWTLASSVMTLYDADGFLTVQYDAEGEELAGVPPFESHHPGGIIHRHLDPVADPGTSAPDASQSGNLLVAWNGGQGHAWMLEDPRIVQSLPTLRAGETMVYGGAGQFSRYYQDGSIVDFTTDSGGAASGSPVFSKISPTEFRRAAPWGREIWNASVYRLITQDGASFTMGSLGAPAPLDTTKTFLRLEADVIELSAKILKLGGDAAAGIAAGGSPPSNAVKADQLLVVLTSIQTSLQLIATALASASPTSGITPAQTALVTAAVASTTSTLSAAQAAGPTCLKSTTMVG